ncbi:hypothetical protein DL96DRAFT_1457386 [Flagelloscypha sp. PMI_526]|nr:hypothetical protein DL96DRAFT_1457386 [Flagelloscypha sp. PMI_526]
MSFKWPERTSKHTPSFKKDAPYSLQLFFKDLEKLFKERDVEMAKAPTNASPMTDVAKIEKTVEYLDGETRVEWRELEVYKQRTSKKWDKFKEGIYEEYPGSNPKRSRKFTIGDMHALIGKTIANGINNEDELGEFARCYFAITKKLLDAKEISKPDILKGFINAFGGQEDVKMRIKQYLQKNTNPRDPIPNSLLKTAAIEALEGPDTIEEAFQPSGRAIQTYARASKAANRAASNSVPSAGLTPVNSNPAPPQKNYNSVGGSFTNFNPNCYYCRRDGCRIPRCEILQKDLERGYCKQDPETKHIQAPTGGGLQRYQGTTLKERLEEYHRINPGHDRDNQPLRSKQTATASMLWEAVAGVQPTYTVEGRKDEGESLEQMRLRLAIMKKEQEEQNELGAYMPSVAPVNLPQRRDPVFKSQNALYDASASQRVLNKILDGPVTVTAREILAISADVSRLMKEANTTHKVPNEQATRTFQKMPVIVPAQLSVFTDEDGKEVEPANLGTDLPDNTAVVNDAYLAYYNATGGLPKGAITAVVTEVIRAVRPTVAQRRTVEALVDPGCSIVSMSDKLCRELALVYNPEIVLPLQSANRQVNHTLGLAPNVPFTFGDITLYLQVHIVKNPPFEVLLGRPFDWLTRIVACTYQDGSQGLTITDPNSGRKVTIPSYC